MINGAGKDISASTSSTFVSNHYSSYFRFIHVKIKRIRQRKSRIVFGEIVEIVKIMKRRILLMKMIERVKIMKRKILLI